MVMGLSLSSWPLPFLIHPEVMYHRHLRPQRKPVKRLSMKVALAILGFALVAAAGAAGWLYASDPQGDVGVHGYIALGLGVGLTVALGAGLMALVFWSARKGHDDIERRS
jgi:hypothetical protein